MRISKLVRRADLDRTQLDKFLALASKVSPLAYSLKKLLPVIKQHAPPQANVVESVTEALKHLESSVQLLQRAENNWESSDPQNEWERRR